MRDAQDIHTDPLHDGRVKHAPCATRRAEARRQSGGLAPKVTQVVAGILERDGRVLICRRRVDQPHPLKWEFPGGKIEGDETPRAALIRELREELGIESEAASEITRYEFTYPGKKPILLIFLRVPAWRGEVENLIFEAVNWEEWGRLKDYDFLEGDAPFLSGGYF
jgi:8-oxo-dGTP diphosphatase